MWIGSNRAWKTYTIVGENPEYCFSVIEADGVADQVVPAVAETRSELLLADVQCRMRAMQAMQRIAAEVLTNYSTFASRDDAWQTMELWQHTLQQIQNSEQEGVEVHTLLEHCLYAFLIIQAHAITSGEPMLLLTPDLFRSLQPLQHLLPKCQFLQTARSVFRLYWMAVHNAKYGGQERAFEEVWKILPWFGVSACLSGTESPRSSSKIHTF